MGLASVSSAVVIHPGDDPLTGVPLPPDDAVGRWGSNASAVAVAPDFAVTTRHQGGGVGTNLVFGSATTIVAEVFTPSTGNPDLRVVRLENTSGDPANLSTWLQPYANTDEVTQTVAIGGFGLGRDESITTTNGSGYSVTGPNILRWGRNVVSGTAPAGDPLGGGGFSSDLLRATFEPDTTGVTGEATVAVGDSGGLWAIESDGEWFAAGIIRGVLHPDEAIHTPSEPLDAVRVSSYADFIQATIPEPTVLSMFAIAGPVLLLRRRPRSRNPA